MNPPTASHRLRVAAAGDVHCREANRTETIESFSALAGEVDLVLLAGDLTSHGTIEEAEILCEAALAAEAPVFAVLGNHDWQGDAAEAIAARVRDRGIGLLEREARVCLLDGIEVGIAGCKGFVGGFAPRHLPDFGEPSLRAVYAETTAEVEALDAALKEIATCPLRIVLLHYSPLQETLQGEPPEIFAFLGSDRLAAPILEHGPDLVLHGHAHAGAARGQIGETPVYNVSQPVVGEAFWRSELSVPAHSSIP
ncbi:MAG TPA: metallophosphoesterase [Solirubrobacterales bacterium]|nr:metallophosphoesterase [Solirubrobacterales bacterium]